MCGFSVRLLVDRQHQRLVGRGEVEPDDLGRLGGERGVLARAPRLAARQVDLLGPQEAPDILHVDIAERFGDQRTAPPREACRGRAVENRQNALVGLGRIFGLRAPVTGLVETSPPLLGKADPPLAGGANRAVDRPRNRPRRQALRRHQHDARSLAQPMFRLARTRQTFEFSALTLRQKNWGRFRDAAHAPLNHDSRSADSEY